MVSRVMRCRCPHCRQRVVQFVSEAAPNVCPHCFKMFSMSSRASVPAWVLGILVLLTATLLIGV